MTSSQHHDPAVREKANRLLAEAGYKVEGVPIPSWRQRKKFLNLALTFLIFASLVSIGSELLLQRDLALPGAKTFIYSDPELLTFVGDVQDSELIKYLVYGGIPGKESPYRQYSFHVKGSKGEAIAIVRAEELSKGGSYAYRIVELRR